MRKYLVLAAIGFFGSFCYAQTVETMKICGEYATVYQMEKDTKAAKRNGGAISEDAAEQYKQLKKDFEKKKKQYEKESGEKFSVRTCKELDLL